MGIENKFGFCYLYWVMPKDNFAVISTGGKQYKVGIGDKLSIEKLSGEPGQALKFSEVLLKMEGDKVEVGTPHVKGAHVEAEVLKQAREDKKIVFRYHSKTRYRKFKGHRQSKTEVRIKSIK